MIKTLSQCAHQACGDEVAFCCGDHSRLLADRIAGQNSHLRCVYDWRRKAGTECPVVSDRISAARKISGRQFVGPGFLNLTTKCLGQPLQCEVLHRMHHRHHQALVVEINCYAEVDIFR